MINDELQSKARELADRPYGSRVWEDTLSNGEIVYLAENSELPGCMAQGATTEEALANLLEARTDYIYYLLVDGLEVPDPQCFSWQDGPQDGWIRIPIPNGTYTIILDKDIFEFTPLGES